MIAQTQIIQSAFSLNIPPKFIYQKDLTLEVRSAIVLQADQAQVQNSWGVITELAKEYQVSRTFIYSTRKRKSGICQSVFSQRNTGFSVLIRGFRQVFWRIALKADESKCYFHIDER